MVDGGPLAPKIPGQFLASPVTSLASLVITLARDRNHFRFLEKDLGLCQFRCTPNPPGETELKLVNHNEVTVPS